MKQSRIVELGADRADYALKAGCTTKSTKDAALQLFWRRLALFVALVEAFECFLVLIRRFYMPGARFPLCIRGEGLNKP